MFDDTYKTIASPSEGLYKEKGSKFLAFAFPVSTTDEVKEHLQRLRKEYYDARHHCYAYVLGKRMEAFRVGDDGEPSGTGGRPIHGQLLSAGVTNTLIVVVRYFGGILLGASGLASAYKAAAHDALAHATIVEHTIDVTYRLRFAYELTGEVMRVLKEQGLQPRNRQYDEGCVMDVNVRETQQVRTYDALSRIWGVTIVVVE